MKQTRSLITFVGCLLSLTVYADDVEPPTLPDSVPTTEATANLLAPFNLEFKNQGMADWRKHDSAMTTGRISARLYGQGSLNESFNIELNTRLRTQISNRKNYQAQNDIRVDVQSLAFSYSTNSTWRWLAGRTNIRNGVATGFNPTDWFKAGSQVIFESLDAADRREDRLGVVALEGIWLHAGNLLSFGYRPDLRAKPDTVASDSDIVGLGLDRTNNRDALFVKYAPSPDSWNNLSLTVSSLYQNNQPSLGAEVSLVMRNNLVLYSEWFAQRRQNLTHEALNAHNGTMRLYHQLASGVTWSVPESIASSEDISLSVEFHFNEAGLKQSQMASWRQAIKQNDARALRIAALAGEKQEPLARQQLFGRFAWNDFWDDNDLSLITTVTPMDGSGFSQLTLSVPILSTSRIEITGYHYFGNSNTIYGSAGRKNGVMLTFFYTL